MMTSLVLTTRLDPVLSNRDVDQNIFGVQVLKNQYIRIEWLVFSGMFSLMQMAIVRK